MNYIKRTLFSVLLLTITLFTSANIKKNILATPSIEDKNLIETFSKIEAVHANGLESIYNYIKTNVDKNPNFRLSKKAFNDAIINFLTENIQASNLNQEILNMDEFDFSLKAEQGISYSSQIVNHTKNEPSKVFIETITNFEKFSVDELKNFQYELYDEFVSDNIKLLEKTDEKILLITMVYVGKSSVKYWLENSQKWIDLSKNPTESAKLGPGKKILAADIGGGLVGAASGAYTGAIGGTVAIPGIGTVAGVTAGFFVGGAVGAIKSSASAGIAAWIGSLWD